MRGEEEKREEKREEGRGKREEGRGKREEGRGKREEGRGKIGLCGLGIVWLQMVGQSVRWLVGWLASRAVCWGAHRYKKDGDENPKVWR